MEMITERLHLRDYTWEDEKEVHAYASDSLVVEHMLWGPNTEEETQDYLRQVIQKQEQVPRTAYDLAVVIRETGQLIGGCGLFLEGYRQAELGYCFNRIYWGRGYATEAAKALVRMGFQDLGLHRIYATCRPDNRGSAKVMLKLGMRYEGHFREHRWHNAKWRDSYQYSILSREFE
ncbi:MAG: GNAT family N-acetyltransferase [Paenibacillaceae bacterium]|uniref:GNAT family N-acetyltransferase n=1 Tax=Paenibacillus mellifer TaxID=2937794 RepID=A0A9X1Y143_9BACL|nr:GNAT family N-acetyltransferase [Paenibacillus mellifer]MBW4840581.1 GNAT family N-acetyltransferase [Paenibacillaceae bacterium]MCK8487706.1 GNAT family N-acetyltransferase [Paenibacillus mellifer]